LKEIFKLVIKLYWKIVPDKIKGVCLFHESCSRYVFRKLDENGFTSGLKALFFRFNNCRTPYLIRKIPKTNEYELHLSSGIVLKDSKINPIIKKECEY
jgi:uncharacterized protein